MEILIHLGIYMETDSQDFKGNFKHDVHVRLVNQSKRSQGLHNP